MTQILILLPPSPLCWGQAGTGDRAQVFIQAELSYLQLMSHFCLFVFRVEDRTPGIAKCTHSNRSTLSQESQKIIFPYYCFVCAGTMLLIRRSEDLAGVGCGNRTRVLRLGRGTPVISGLLSHLSLTCVSTSVPSSCPWTTVPTVWSLPTLRSLLRIQELGWGWEQQPQSDDDRPP